MALQGASFIKDATYSPMPYTTLNEKYDIEYTYDTEELPQLGWYGLGIDFSPLIDDDEADLKDYVHSVADFDTFLPLPFIVRDKSVGLTQDEKDRYGIFVEKTIDDTDYILCYLRKIDALESTVKISEVERDEDGRYNTVEHVQENPPTPKLSGDESNRGMITSTNAVVELSEYDVGKLLEASDLLYPEIDEDVRHSVREIALYSGIRVPDDIVVAQALFFKYIELNTENEEAYSTRVSIGSLTPKVKL
jgi:hypothetical protein